MDGRLVATGESSALEGEGRRRSALTGLGEVALVAALAVLACAGMIALTGREPVSVMGTLVGYPLFNANGLGESVVRSVPLMLVGVGIAVAFRARVFNIGAEGQIIVGGMVAVALAGPLSGLGGGMGAAAFLAAGALAGLIYGGLAGVLRARFNANEIIVTIMLNYIAIQFLAWAVRGPLQESMGIFPRSDAIDAVLRLPILIADTRVHLGIVLALAAAFALALVMRWTRLGFQLRVSGDNPHAAHYAGMRRPVLIVVAIAISGALAGLAGAVEVAALHGRLQEGFASTFGISAIAVALLARLNPLAVPVTSFAFAALYVGSGAIQRQYGVPFPIVYVIEGIVILAFLAATFLRERRKVM